MIVRCSKRDLVKALSIAKRAISTKTLLPVLSGIKLEAADEKLSLTTSDTDLSIITHIDAKITEHGTCVVKAKLFEDIIRNLPDSEVLISADDQNTVITCENSRFDITNIVNEFPNLFPDEEYSEFVVNREKFSQLVTMTAFSACPDASRGVLQGVLIECEDNDLSMTSIDGFRISHATAKDVANESEFSTIIEAGILTKIADIAREESDEVITVKSPHSGKVLIMEFENTKISSRVLDGKYMDYKVLMDKSDLTTFADVDKNELLQALSRLLVFQIQGKSAVTIDITDTQIKLTSDNVEFGNGRETLNANMDGDQLKIKFNNAFLLEALKVIPDDVVRLSASTPVKPMFITPVDSEDYTYMILPLRLN